MNGAPSPSTARITDTHASGTSPPMRKRPTIPRDWVSQCPAIGGPLLTVRTTSPPSSTWVPGRGDTAINSPFGTSFDCISATLKGKLSAWSVCCACSSVRWSIRGILRGSPAIAPSPSGSCSPSNEVLGHSPCADSITEHYFPNGRFASIEDCSGRPCRARGYEGHGGPRGSLRSRRHADTVGLCV